MSKYGQLYQYHKYFGNCCYPNLGSNFVIFKFRGLLHINQLKMSMKYYIFGLSSKSKILANTILFSFFTFYIDEKEIDLKWSKIGKIGLEKEGY